MQQLVFNFTLFQSRSQVQFHHIHAARKDNGGQYRVGVLMEGRILKIVVIERDEDGEREEEEGQVEREEAGARVREGGVAHEAGGVYHGQLVNELHGVFERRVEEEAAGADEQVTDKADEEDGVVAVFAARLDAPVGEVEEEEVREGVDYLGGVRGCVVILAEPSVGFNGIESVGVWQTSSHQLIVEVTGSQ